MNIYALKNHKVRCSSLTNGYDHHKEVAQEYLELGKEYTIEATKVHSWHTQVWLQEFPEVMFNSVFFEDVVEQEEELDKQHPDYSRYN